MPTSDRKREWSRKWYHENKEQAKQNRRRWVAQNEERNRLYQRAYYYQREYGITLEQLQEMEQQQKGCCAICGVHPERTLHVDHSHETHEVRGLLCSNCNTALGLLHDSPEIADRVSEYLRRRQ